MNRSLHISYVDRGRDGGISVEYGAPRPVHTYTPLAKNAGRGEESANTRILMGVYESVYRSFMMRVSVRGDTFEYARYPISVSARGKEKEEGEEEEGGAKFSVAHHMLSIDGWIQESLRIGRISDILLRLLRVHVCLCVANTVDASLNMCVNVIRSASSSDYLTQRKYFMFTEPVDCFDRAIFTVARVLNNRGATNPRSVREHCFVIPMTVASFRACGENVYSFIVERIMCKTMSVYGLDSRECVSLLSQGWILRANIDPNRNIYI